MSKNQLAAKAATMKDEGSTSPGRLDGGEGIPALSSIVLRLGEWVVCDITNAAHAGTDLDVGQKV
jgi:hypothetical protein